MVSENSPETHGLRPGSVLAGYRIESQLGSGGMAVVYRARDGRLGRLVALKVLAAHWADDKEFRQRFLVESRAAATVDHPHVIPVFEAGDADGELFIAMRLVSGSDLREVARREGVLAPTRALGLLSPVSSALDAAHAAGLVHRDVKPANILIDSGPGRPDHVYLSDFGLAKGGSAGLSLTGTGQYLGTPQYSSPEQVQGRPVDGRTDQYALACVAFLLLTGRVPFERDNDMAVLWAHATEPPPDLAWLRPDLPAKAAPVLARALAKEPVGRYPSCQDFTEALRDALGLSPYASRDTSDGITAPLAGAPASEIPTPPQYPPASGQAADAPGQATITGGPGFPGPAHADGHPAARNDGVPAGRWTRRRLTVIAAACVVTAAVITALGWPAPPPKLVPNLSRTLVDPSGANLNAAVFSPDDKTVAAGDTDGSVYLWDVSSGRRIATLTDPGGQSVNGVAFSPDGTTLAAAGSNGSVYLWDVSSRRRTATLTDPNGANVYGVAFSPDGKTLAVGDDNDSAYLWDVSSHRRTATLTDPGGGGVYGVAFSPDGTTLAVADYDDKTYVWDVSSGQPAVTAVLPDSGTQGVYGVAFWSDGTTLAAADHDGHVDVWDVSSRQRVATLVRPGTGNLYGVAFWPDGKTLAVADDDGSTYLWDVSSHRRVATLTNPQADSVYGVAFSPDGTMLAAVGSGGNAYLWRLTG